MITKAKKPFKKYTKAEIEKWKLSKMSTNPKKNSFVKTKYQESEKKPWNSNSHFPKNVCSNKTYILDHKLLAWKCNRCGKYKKEERKITLDWLKQLGCTIDDKEYQECLNYEIP